MLFPIEDGLINTSQTDFIASNLRNSVTWCCRIVSGEFGMVDAYKCKRDVVPLLPDQDEKVRSVAQEYIALRCSVLNKKPWAVMLRAGTIAGHCDRLAAQRKSGTTARR